MTDVAAVRAWLNLAAAKLAAGEIASDTTLKGQSLEKLLNEVHEGTLGSSHGDTKLKSFLEFPKFGIVYHSQTVHGNKAFKMPFDGY